MKNPMRVLVALLTTALLLAGCAVAPTSETDVSSRAAGAKQRLVLDPATAERILALDPEHVTSDDVRATLVRGPAPHIVLLHGGVFPVHLIMENFARFLISMGYPEPSLRDPGTRELTYSPYDDSARQAGLIAWLYERDGLRPMMVGHSQGGIQAVKILHELAGNLDTPQHPFDPVARRLEERTTIVDPLTGRERPVIGVSVCYVAVVGTGGASLALPNHWAIISRIRTIPDTVDDFVGYRLGLDFFAWDIPGLEGIKTFSANGKAKVENVTLPASYSHVFVPLTSSLASDPELRRWIDRYDPNDKATTTPPGDVQNLYFAAEVWHGVKRHWVMELQNLVRAQRARGQTGAADRPGTPASPVAPPAGAAAPTG